MHADCGQSYAVTYYSAIIAWAAYYLGASFVWPLPWATEDCGADAECLADPARALPLPSSDSYFTDTVLQSNDSSLADGVARVFSGPLVGCAPPLILESPWLGVTRGRGWGSAAAPCMPSARASSALA